MRSAQYRGTLVWLALAVVVAVAHQWIPEATWLMVHLMLLGALSHAILVWSRHFAHSLLRTPTTTAEQARHTWRLRMHAGGAVTMMAGVLLAQWHLAALGAVVVGVAALWHGMDLLRATRDSLPHRFRVTIWYYLAASLMLPVGATFGVLLATGPGQSWFQRLLVAHVASMLLGWVLLTVVGTLLTFWPTMLRARMDERAERFTRQAMVWLVAGLVLTVVAALIGDSVSVVVGLAVYAFGLVWCGRGLVSPLRKRVPREFAPVSVGLALVWLVVGLLWLVVILGTRGWGGVAEGLGDLLAVVAVGFAAQLLTGALTFLVPSVMGGGPTAVRAGLRELQRFASARIIVINVGLVTWLQPVPSWVRVTVSSVVLTTLAVFIVLVGRAVLATRRAVATGPDAHQRDQGSAIRPVWSRRGILAGTGVVLAAVVAGVAADPRAAGLPGWPRSRPEVEPTGRTTTVRVVAKDMRFLPDEVEVPRGDMVQVSVINEDEVDSHDLRIDDVQTPRIDPGNTAVLEYGPVAEDIEGYCTIVGHRASGMVFNVVVRG